MYFCSLNALSESPRPVLHEKTRLCKTVCTGAYSDRRKQKRGRDARPPARLRADGEKEIEEQKEKGIHAEIEHERERAPHFHKTAYHVIDDEQDVPDHVLNGKRRDGIKQHVKEMYAEEEHPDDEQKRKDEQIADAEQADVVVRDKIQRRRERDDDEQARKKYGRNFCLRIRRNCGIAIS